jgi:hypothetical protein
MWKSRKNKFTITRKKVNWWINFLKRFSIVQVFINWKRLNKGSIEYSNEYKYIEISKWGRKRSNKIGEWGSK